MNNGPAQPLHLVLEADGVLIDVQAACYAAHGLATAELGWSRMNPADFWRQWRTKGPAAVYLRGAPALKAKKYQDLFPSLLDHDEALQQLSLHPGLPDVVRRLSRAASITVVTLGANAGARQRLIKSIPGADALGDVHSLSADPRMRGGELEHLRRGHRRAVIVAASDALVRAASGLDYLPVGVSSGGCSARRLQQAGADVVFPDVRALAESIAEGCHELLQAGLLPLSDQGIY